MKRWPRRLGCLLFIMVWVVGISLPFVAFALAAKGEIRLGGAERAIRIFVVRGEENEGVGVARQRPLPRNPSCYKTNVTYLMWRGQGENATYCSCHTTGAIACPP